MGRPVLRISCNPEEGLNKAVMPEMEKRGQIQRLVKGQKL